MGLLKIYDSDKTENQKDGYNSFTYSLLKVDGDFVPSWYLTESDVTTTVYIQELAPTALENNEIDVLSNEDISTGGYTTAYGNSLIYADKQIETIAGVHRLKIDVDGTIYYSDIFMNINNDINIYVRLSSYEYVRVYKY